MSFLCLFLVGILIGSAMVVPGVSGAVIAVIFGLYDKGINALVNLFKDFKNNFMFLFIVGMGILIGAIWFSNILLFLYNKNEFITKLSFIGFILGGIPYLFKEVKNKGKKINYVVLIISLLISLIMFLVSRNILSEKINYSFGNLFLGGIIYSIGKVVPGISGSFLMIIIGMYNFVLQIIAHPITYGLMNVGKVIPFILGLIIGILILINIMKKLLDKHFGIVYSIIIGLVIGSLPALIPIFITPHILIIGIIVMIFSFLLSYLLLKSI